MLEDLKVLNGNMSLKFDPLNNIYTIFVGEQVNELEIEYKLYDSSEIKIVGNENLKIGKNEIILEITNEEKLEKYYLYVYKEKTEDVLEEENNFIALNIEKEEVWEYAVPVISVSCFLIILITFTFLFRKKSKRNNLKINFFRKILKKLKFYKF